MGAVFCAGVLLLVPATAHAQECVHALDGLVSWWSGDTDASDIQDGNDGVLKNGALAGASGKVGGAFSFDGVDDHVRVAASANLDVGAGYGFTIDAWINPADVSIGRPIVEWDKGTDYWPGVHLWLGVINTGDLYANIVGLGETNHVVVSSGGVFFQMSTSI
jgi:hypothetical protein